MIVRMLFTGELVYIENSDICKLEMVKYCSIKLL